MRLTDVFCPAVVDVLCLVRPLVGDQTPRASLRLAPTFLVV
ncbi:hypothetical protein [Streptomyces mirabilis]